MSIKAIYIYLDLDLNLDHHGNKVCFPKITIKVEKKNNPVVKHFCQLLFRCLFIIDVREISFVTLVKKKKAGLSFSLY